MSTPRRRTSFGPDPVNYAAVGCTQAADVLVFPPAGFQARFLERKLGSGAHRFTLAAEGLMSWGVHLGIGDEILEIHRETKQHPDFLRSAHETSQPRVVTSNTEHIFTATGHEYVAAGMTVTMRTPSFLSRPHDFRVITTDSSARNCGYILGTVSAGPVIGERKYSVEWRADDTVWFTLISVTKTSAEKRYRVWGPLLFVRERLRERQQSKALLANRLV